MSKGAWVSTLVLMEATWVLTAVYDLTHAEIATAIDMLLHTEISPLKSPIAWPQHSSSIATARRWGSPIVWSSKLRGKPATFRWEPSTEISANSTEPKDRSFNESFPAVRSSRLITLFKIAMGSV